MNELQVSLNIALANTFLMYFKAHSYHWNVEGMFFSQYHDFFGDLYEELFDAVDPFAEQIRAVDAYAPISLGSILRYGTIGDDIDKPLNIKGMLGNLIASNQQAIDSLNAAFKLAEQQDKQGLMDFLAARLDAHAKHGWMLKSSNTDSLGQ